MGLRKNQSDASEATNGEVGAGKGRRRDGRGLGPFSGGQLTMIIVTFAVLLLFPIGAWALTFSNVAITDPGGVNQAKVDANNNLYTATHDAVSGVAAKVNSFGQLSVAASGSVTATPTPPDSSYNAVPVLFGEAGGACHSVTPTVPTGKALMVTSVTVDILSVITGPVGVQIGSATPGSPCGSLNVADIVQISGAKVNQIVPMPSGFPVKTGHVVYVSIGSSSTDATAVASVHGYLVSATCTVTGPPAGCN
jgi:hypothetical protein